jgi:hypothetical protein
MRPTLLRTLAAAATGALLLTACGDDAALDALGNVLGGSDEVDAVLDELGVEITDEERDELEELVAGSGDGSATITIDGVPFESRGISCGARSDFYEVTALGVDQRDLQVRFSHDSGSQYYWDDGSINLYTDEGTWHSRDRDLVVGADDHAIGAGVVYEDAWAQEGERGAEHVIELEILCADGVQVRARPEPAEEPSPSFAFPDDFDVDPSAGLAGTHFDVEIPDEEGTGVLFVDGERYEMMGNCQAPTLREVGDIDPDDPTWWFDWRANFSDSSPMGIGTEGVNMSLHRRLGEFFSDPPLARSEWVVIGQGLAFNGTSQYQEDVHGTVSTDTRDFLTSNPEPIVVVTEDGVITARGRIDGSEAEHLTGEFEFGGRCDEWWDPAG